MTRVQDREDGGGSDVVVAGAIAEAALREGQGSLLVIWLVAINLKASPGANAIGRRRLVAMLDEFGIFSRSYSRQLLRQGDGLFWHLGDRSTFLMGAEAVANGLGNGRGGRHRQVIAIEELLGRASRRGALLGAAVRSDRPVSQASLRKTTGVSERSQRRYRGNGSFSVQSQTGDLTLIMAALSRDGRQAWANKHGPAGVYQAGGRVLKRLPNLHVPNGERIAPGRRTKAILRGQALDFGKGTQTVPRVWFESELSWARCRALKLGTGRAIHVIDPVRQFNVAYAAAGPGRWEAVRC